MQALVNVVLLRRAAIPPTCDLSLNPKDSGAYDRSHIFELEEVAKQYFLQRGWILLELFV
jgi:hypothetical protein